MKPAVILVEGKEDEAFASKLIEMRNVGAFEFSVAEGNTNFKKALDGLIAESGVTERKAVIIVADNDGAPGPAFQSIRQQIIDAGLIPPAQPREVVQNANFPLMAVLMLPWDNQNGCLETLCLSATAPKYATQVACVEALVQCVGAAGWDIAKQAKLRMRGLLASVCEANPNTPLTYAWTTKGGRPGDIFPLGNPVFDDIAGFFAAFV